MNLKRDIFIYIFLASSYKEVHLLDVEGSKQDLLVYLLERLDSTRSSTENSLNQENTIWPEKRMKWAFKEENSEAERIAECEEIRAKYPDRVPVIVEKAPKSNIPEINKRKFLVPADLTVAQFMYIIRKRINLPPEKPLFLFVNKVLPTTSATMGAIAEEHSDTDGFLYVAYSGENTFGKRLFEQ